jgi:hypothetical protein
MGPRASSDSSIDLTRGDPTLADIFSLSYADYELYVSPVLRAEKDLKCVRVTYSEDGRLLKKIRQLRLPKNATVGDAAREFGLEEDICHYRILSIHDGKFVKMEKPANLLYNWDEIRFEKASSREVEKRLISVIYCGERKHHIYTLGQPFLFDPGDDSNIDPCKIELKLRDNLVMPGLNGLPIGQDEKVRFRIGDHTLNLLDKTLDCICEENAPTKYVVCAIIPKDIRRDRIHGILSQRPC